MDKAVLEKLNSLIEGGLKKKDIETKFGMPLNSLSGYLSGKKVLPNKYVSEILGYNGIPVKKESGVITEVTKDVILEKPEIVPEIQKPTKVETIRTQIAKNQNDGEEIKKASERINKDYGAGSIMKWGEKTQTEYQVVSTGSLGLDIALGVMGLPRGRIVEIVGWESSGKSTIALNVIANAQKQGLKCVLVDAESAFDPEYADSLGVKLDEMQYCQPDYGEQALEIADRMILSGEIGVVVIDSVAALVPKAELEGEMGDSKMGLHAKLMSQACRKMVGSIAKTNCLCIFINQFRHKIGVMFGNPEVPTGGNALQFYSSIRLEVRRSTTEANSVTHGGIKEGNLTTVKVVKNKCAAPFRQAKFNIMYGTGIDRFGEIVDLGISSGVITKSGSWLSYKNAKLGQGAEQAADVLVDNPELSAEIEAKIIEHFNQ
jgi:recombination protein RecA